MENYEIVNCPCWRDEQCTENSLIRQTCKENSKCLLKEMVRYRNLGRDIMLLLEIPEEVCNMN